MVSLKMLTKIMTNKYKILANFIKDMSSETTDVQSYLFVKENISKYQLNIDITSKALKNNMIEVSTILKFEDKEPNERKSHFEIVYISIIKVDENITEKKTLEKIVLCDLQNEIYPKIEKSFLDLLHNSGFPGVKLEKKIDFDKLYNQKFN
jgi:preprotein translocase subunit SecB